MNDSNSIVVSICSITYNHAPYIRQCLEGFLMQKTKFRYEILINDDCSTDGTTDIIREYAQNYPSLITPVYHEENLYSKGVRGMAEKFLIPLAKGRYIAICEGDDYWIDQNKLQKQVEFLETHPEIDLCCSASQQYLQKKGEIIGTNGTNLCERYETCILGNNDIYTATSLIRKESFVKCRDELKTFLPQDLIIDTAYWYWFAYYKKVKYFNEETAVYRILENSACHSTDPQKCLWMGWRFLRLKLYFLMRYPIKENHQEVTQSILSEIENYTQFAQHVSGENVRQSQTYKIGRIIKKILNRRI